MASIVENYVFRTQPYRHQREALMKGASRQAFAYLMEMGTGKTKTTIDNIGILWEADLLQAVVIFAPKGVYSVWARFSNGQGELRTHLPERILERTSIEVWSSALSKRKREEMRARLCNHMTDRLLIVVMNIEAIRGKDAYDMVWEMMRVHKTMMVIDESTVIKNPDAQVTKMAVRLGQRAAFRRILSGGPITRWPTDLYSQFEFLGPRMLDHRSFYSFRAEFCVLREIVTNGRTLRVTVASQNLERLSKLVDQHSFRARKKDCLDLPPKIYQRRPASMSDEQVRVYNDIRTRSWAELEGGGEVSTNMVITQLLRLHQLVCGHVTTDDGRQVRISETRLVDLDNTIEEASVGDGGIIIWACYRLDLLDIAARLRRDYGQDSVAEYHGEIPQRSRDEGVAAFQAGERKFIVANPQVGARGGTWTAGRTVIYYANHRSLDLRKQSEDRAHRSGQTHPVNYVDLVAEGTVDESIIRAWAMGMDVVEAVLRDGPRQWII